MAAQLRKLLSKLIRFQNRGVREHPARQRTTRGRIIEVTRRYMGVHVWYGVAKGCVVELARPVGSLDGFGGRANVGPVAGKFFVGEVAGIGHMPGTAEGHDSCPWLGRPPLKVGIGPPTGEEADAPQILARASLGALGAA